MSARHRGGFTGFCRGRREGALVRDDAGRGLAGSGDQETAFSPAAVNQNRTRPERLWKAIFRINRRRVVFVGPGVETETAAGKVGLASRSELWRTYWISSSTA